VSQQFPVERDDPHVQVLHEQDHAFASMPGPDPDVMQPRSVAKRHPTVFVDPIPAHAHAGTDDDLRSRRSAT
jgi:hypothetical protein